ncbi:MAG: hypothetical protein MR593_05325 [Intestinibacter sp.]|uniref:hypothetical protein n=1 Tax=Intestinibacter sp. TaxID=1965304 RepID=UPI0025B9FA37|nr:hypothetical protein [Intestinibacter sp.]MCI6737517.1 hypothetical protein [Intestinibacter sp.]
MKSNVNEITAGVMIKLNDDITTNDVITLDENNIDTLAKKCFNKIDEGFIDRVNFNEGGFIVAGEDFLKGPSDEIVAKVFSNLKIKGILAKSFDQKHKENLINNDIIPMEFVNSDEYDKVGLYDILKLKNLYEDLPKGILEVINITKGTNFWVKL